MRTQVTFDCADPHAQAAFWARVYGTAVEDHSALVDRLPADGQLPAEERITIDGRSAFREVAAVRDPDGAEPRLSFQRVPEGKSDEPRADVRWECHRWAGFPAPGCVPWVGRYEGRVSR